MYKFDADADNPRDRLEALDRRIARMQSLNTKHGDVLALRLIEHAQTERRQILAQMAGAERKPA